MLYNTLALIILLYPTRTEIIRNWLVLADSLDPLTAQVNATVAIILKDDTADWRTKPVLAVHIANGAELEPESV